MKPESLIKAALRARTYAHAPYSRYRVGAALLAEDGRIFTGCNVENASYGLTNCAERTAFFKAVSEGTKKFVALAVATDDGASMCGACRQVAAEFGPEIEVYLADRRGKFRSTTVGELLPGAFDGAELTAKRNRAARSGRKIKGK